MISTIKRRAARRIIELVESRRRGAIIPLVAFLLILFVATVAFSVDVGYMVLARTQLRVATDAAARAGGEALARTQNLPTAIQAAKDLAAANMVGGQPLILADQDVIPGNSVAQGNGSWTFTPNGQPINSIRVVGRRTSNAPSGTVPLFFGGIFGAHDFAPTKESTVVRTDRDVCLVVDRSSSMKLDLASTAETMDSSDSRMCQKPDPVNCRWAALAAAVQVFTDTLNSTPQDEHVSLTSFASDFDYCGVHNNAADINQVLTGNLSLVDSGMSGISNTVFNGMTDTAAGIDRGVVSLYNASARPYATKTIILLTDGHPTAGRDPVLAANDAYAKNITIHTITFGCGAGAAQMQAVASAAGGKYYDAPDAATLKQIFRQIALSLSVTLTE